MKRHKVQEREPPADVGRLLEIKGKYVQVCFNVK